MQRGIFSLLCAFISRSRGIRSLWPDMTYLGFMIVPSLWQRIYPLHLRTITAVFQLAMTKVFLGHSPELWRLS